jgi:branched-chain amino acid transport system permease protein
MTDPQLWFSVVEEACFFGAIGLAYLLVLLGAGFFNFAVGAYTMIGGLAASWLVIMQGLPMWVSILLAVLFVSFLAVATEVAVVRPIQHRSSGAELPAIVAVAAMLFGLSQAAGVILGRQQLPGQGLLDFAPFEVAGGFVTPAAVVIVTLAGVAFASVMVWSRITATGRALRAVGDNRTAAELLGLPVSRVRLTSFALSGLIAAGAGIAFSAKAGVAWDRGLNWALLGFLALVIGGTGSWWAPLLGGFVLALLHVFIPFYLSGEFTDYAILGIALAFFSVRPRGITGRHVRV